jgi:hypothetical protein
MSWRSSFGFTAFLTRKGINTPRMRFHFKSRTELETMSAGDRMVYFEDMLAALYSRRDDLDDKARDHLTRAITNCLQFRHAWKRLPETATPSSPMSAPSRMESVRDIAGKT